MLAFSCESVHNQSTPGRAKAAEGLFFENGYVMGKKGAIFENLVATTLLKCLHFLEDRDGYHYELRYLRDKERREVDFVIVKDKEIQELIEVKFQDDSISRSLQYYTERLKPRRSTRIVCELARPYECDGIEVLDALSYVNRYPLV